MCDNEISDLELEITRHHRDFTNIALLIDSCLEYNKDPIETLKEIRNIVG